MNYEPNTTEWKIGDLVLHDADAKTEKMLMRVTAIHFKSYVTVYAFPPYSAKKESFENDIGFLHNPALFGIDVEKVKGVL